MSFQRKMILTIIILSIGVLYLSYKLLNNSTQDDTVLSEEVVQDYTEDKISNNDNTNTVNTIRKIVKVYDTIHIEKIRVIQKTVEDEKNYIDSTHNNDLLRAIGSEYIKRYNMRK